MSDDDRPWPTEIRLAPDRRNLTVAFADGARFAYTAEFLRVLSPSAEVQGHSPEQRQTVPGKRDVGIISIERVGNYAVRIVFDDLHDTGIYSWEYLHRMGREHDEMWASYMAELEEKGLSREPPPRRS